MASQHGRGSQGEEGGRERQGQNSLLLLPDGEEGGAGEAGQAWEQDPGLPLQGNVPHLECKAHYYVQYGLFVSGGIYAMLKGCCTDYQNLAQVVYGLENGRSGSCWSVEGWSE